ncbi:MAG: HAMP domain-containing protein, partial [Anaerolineae bacterium]|nr:HAMP domain-containing protein [Anaerolineae bacterium]
HQTWDGVESWLREQSTPASQSNTIPMKLCALVDDSGMVIVDSGPFHVGDYVPAQQSEEGIPIVIDGQQVGTVLLAAPPPGPDPREQRYLDRTNQALLIGAVGAGAMALLVGLLLSRHFLRPLAELTTAIRGMRQGELSQQVRVRTQDELGELAQAFNQMSADIHRVNQLRRQMTADIAHDLRTPLTVISGYLEGLRDGTLKPTAQRFDAMYTETVVLRRLIDDLRTLSLVDAGELKLVYQVMPPDELLEQVRQSFEPIAEEEQVAFAVKTDASLPNVQVDRDRMAQVLANLVTNALRTPAGAGHAIGARSGQAVHFWSAIPARASPNKLPNIFERFYRVEEAWLQDRAGRFGTGDCQVDCRGASRDDHRRAVERRRRSPSPAIAAPAAVHPCQPEPANAPKAIVLRGRRLLDWASGGRFGCRSGRLGCDGVGVKSIFSVTYPPRRRRTPRWGCSG